MQTDPISDLLTRIRNAAKARHARVDIPTSKLKVEVARILKEEGYISTYKLIEEKQDAQNLAPVSEIHAGQAQRDHRPEARLEARQPPLSRLHGDPPRRRRDGHQHHDHAQGVMTGRAARKGRVGGEVLVRGLVKI